MWNGLETRKESERRRWEESWNSKKTRRVLYQEREKRENIDRYRHVYRCTVRRKEERKIIKH